MIYYTSIPLLFGTAKSQHSPAFLSTNYPNNSACTEEARSNVVLMALSMISMHELP
jgi:hypothetical protein